LRANFLNWIGDHEAARTIAQSVLTLATITPDPVAEEGAIFNLCMAMNFMGSHRDANTLFRERIAARQNKDLLERRSGLALTSVNHRLQFMFGLGETGDFDEAERVSEELLQIADEVKTPVELISAWMARGHLDVRRGDFTRSLGLLARAHATCLEVSFITHLTNVEAVLGYARAFRHELPEALELLESAVARAASTGYVLAESYYTTWLGEAALLDSRPDTASAHGQRALDLARSRGQRGAEASALRLLGESAATTDPSGDSAEPWYRQALGLASALGMRPLVAHCHAGLARLFHRQARPEAAEHRAIATAMFREMGMLYWLERLETSHE
jgi:tetratricopeptide (TPR) repeat protein